MTTYYKSTSSYNLFVGLMTFFISIKVNKLIGVIFKKRIKAFSAMVFIHATTFFFGKV